MGCSGTRNVLWAIAMIGVAASCSRRQSSESSEVAVPAAPLMTTNVRFGFAVYYLPVPLTNPSAVLRRLLKGQFTNIQHVAEIDPAADGVFLWSQMITNAEQTHPAPSLESLRYFGRGLTREEAVKLQTSSTVYLLGFGYRSNHVWSGMKLAVQLTEAFAGQTGGIIWDDETREAFSVEEWHSRRASAWDDTVP